MKRIATLCAFVLLPLVTGCAAMFTGTTSDVMITGAPEGGFFVADGVEHPLPYTAELRKKDKELTLRHPDFGERTIVVDRKFGVGFLLMDVLFTPGFGVSGLLVDGSTGAWYTLPPMISVDFRTSVPAGAAEGSAGASAAP